MYEELRTLADVRLGKLADEVGRQRLIADQAAIADFASRGISGGGAVWGKRVEIAVRQLHALCEGRVRVWAELLRGQYDYLEEDAALFVLHQVEEQAESAARHGEAWLRSERAPAIGERFKTAAQSAIARARRDLKEMVEVDRLARVKSAAVPAVTPLTAASRSPLRVPDGFAAQVMRVMLAGPSDVVAEKGVAREVIERWSSVHGEKEGLILLPMSWEADAAPEFGGRAQEVLNKQLLRRCHLLVAMFWNRAGSPTGRADGGTIEEVQEHVERKRPAMVYFSDAPAAPSAVDAMQRQRLEAFRDWCRPKALVEQYGSVPEFRDKFTHQLARRVNEIMSALRTP